MKVVDFPTRFVDNPVRPHEREKDSKVGQKLAKCVWAFVAILIEYWRRVKAEGLVEPGKVTEATEKYQTDNDVFADFVQDELVRGLPEHCRSRMESGLCVGGLRKTTGKFPPRTLL